MSLEPSFLRKPRKDANYLAWLATITVGVTLGNILSTVIMAKAAQYQVEMAMREAAQMMNQAVKDSNEAAAAQARRMTEMNAQQRAQQEAQRRMDPTGQKLAKACEEWRDADANLHSYTTGQEMQRHCGRYDLYVRNGIFGSDGVR